EGPLGPDNSLGDGRLRNEERARDFVRCQTAKQAKSERNARFGRENRMTGNKDKAQQVVADVIIDRRVEINRGQLMLGVDLMTELLLLACELLASSDQID